MTEDAIVVQFSKPTQKGSNLLRWIIGLIVFILIWAFGGGLLLAIANHNRIDGRFAGLIAFVIGLLVMMYIGFSGKETNNEEQAEEQ